MDSGGSGDDPLPPHPKSVAVRRRLVSWDPESGQPVVLTEMVLTKIQIQEAISAAVSEPYHDPENKEPEFAGLTNMEVMLVKQVRAAAKSGAPNEVSAILDRILGRPKQTTESHTFTATYEDLLNKLARDEGRLVSPSSSSSPNGEAPPEPSRPIIDVAPSGSSPDSDLDIFS